MKMDIKIDEELINNEKWEGSTKRKASLNANYCDGKKRKDSALKVSLKKTKKKFNKKERLIKILIKKKFCLFLKGVINIT